jgi:hypothetical protein
MAITQVIQPVFISRDDCQELNNFNRFLQLSSILKRPVAAAVKRFSFLIMEKHFTIGENLTAETRKAIEQLLKADELKRQYIEELHTRSCYRDFFEHYSDESVHAFIREYAARKAYYAIHGDKKAEEQSEAELKFRHQAEKYFAEIQQKKLFDLQCLWRTGKLKLDGIGSTADFAPLEFCIFSVPFLKPVTEHELNLYLDFLSTEETVHCHDYRWQDYDSFKMAFESGQWDRIPEWYRFYDKALGAESLLQGEDLMSRKETEWWNCKTKRVESLPYSEEPVKPDLEFNYNSLEFFVYTFEDRRIIRQFMAAERFHPDIDNNRMLQEAWNMLCEADENICIQQTGNWKTAIIETANQYRKQKTAECMKDLFREYQLRLKAGIPFHAGENDTLFEYHSMKANLYNQKLIAAKRAGGKETSG